MSTIFASFNFWKEVETFGDEKVDLNLPNLDSEVLPNANSWFFSSLGDVWLPCFASVFSFVEESVDPKESRFPIPTFT